MSPSCNIRQGAHRAPFLFVRSGARRVVAAPEALLGDPEELRISGCEFKHPRSGEVPLNPETQWPPEGPHDFRGHLRRSRKSDIAAEEDSSADYATCRHAPRPKGEQRARGCVLCEPRSALTFSPPVAARTPNKRPSYLRTLRMSECELTPVPLLAGDKRPSCLRTLRIIFLQAQARDSVFEKMK